MGVDVRVMNLIGRNRKGINLTGINLMGMNPVTMNVMSMNLMSMDLMSMNLLSMDLRNIHGYEPYGDEQKNLNMFQKVHTVGMGLHSIYCSTYLVLRGYCTHTVQ